MRQHLITAAAIASVLTAGAAMAADMPLKAPLLKAPPPAAFSWAGCYIGGNVGGKWAEARDDVFIPAAAGAAAASARVARGTATTVIGGGQVGCNWQSSNWVYGLEGDIDAQDWKRSGVLGAGVAPPLVAGDTFSLRSDWQASARARLGYAFDRTLLYVTGGAAFTNVKANSNFIAVGIFPQTLASDSKTLVGATVGGGIEHAITNNWTFGLEGRYSWYGSESFNAGSVAVFNTGGAAPVFVFAPARQTVRLDTVEVKAKLNWKFDWGGPVVARY
jgi:outer membrane immunogenic protein